MRLTLSAGCVGPRLNGTCNSDGSTASSVDLYWLPTESTIYYQVSFRRMDGESVVLNITSTGATVPSLTAGYLYTFHLQSFGAGGASEESRCTYSTCKFYSLPTGYTDFSSFVEFKKSLKRRFNMRCAVQCDATRCVTSESTRSIQQ